MMIGFLHSPASAAPPPAGSPDALVMAGLDQQILRMRNQRDEICCSTADGRPVPMSQLQWHDGQWWLLFNKTAWHAGTVSNGYADGEWLPIPEAAETTRVTPAALTMVWVLDEDYPIVRCFAPIGTQ